MKKIFITILPFLFLLSCSSSKIYVDEDGQNWQASSSSLSTKPIYELYLIGDAGSPRLDIQEPSLRFLESQLAQSNERSAIVYLGDNIYLNGLPDSTDAQRDFYEARIIGQMKILKDFKGRVFFIPGNHDWDDGEKEGLTRIKRQEDFIEAYLDRGNVFLPDDGFPGPIDVELMDDDEHPALQDDIRLIILDTQWWLHRHEKSYGDTGEYDLVDGGDFLNELEDILKKRQGDFLVMAAHHPIKTAGPHGGYLPLSTHFKPPIFGSLYAMYRRVFGLKQDVTHHRYKQMADAIQEAFSENEEFIYASGHSHSLQYFRVEGKRFNQHYLVSGSGTKKSYVAKGRGTEFSYAGEGHIKVLFMEDGSVWMEAWAPIGNGETGQLLYKTQMKPPYDNPVEDAVEELPDYDYTDSTKVLAANPKYGGKGPLFNALVGAHNREMWTVESEFPVFDVTEIRGGLIPVRMGGKGQSNTLHLEDKEGNEFVLRSVDKQAGKIWEEELKKTIALEIAQDQFSILNPYSALVIPILADAAGVYHTNPKIYYVPHDPQLGRYADEIGGQLALFEEKPDNNMNTVASVGYSEEVVAHRDMIREVDGDIDHRVDQEMFLRARLLDMLIADWDRHSDQWRWATFEPEDEQGKIYRPIPRDRDVAFMKMTGLIPRLAKIGPFFQYQNFDEDYGNLIGLNFNSLPLTRRFTNQLTKEDWQRISQDIQSSITDGVIETAVKAYPKEIYDHFGTETIKTLKARRDKLNRVALSYFEMLNGTVSVPASNKRERFVITGLSEGRVQVQVFKLSGKGVLREKYYDRIFNPSETKEVRLFGMGDDDEFHFEGPKTQIKLIVNGGPGVDEYILQGDHGIFKNIELFDTEEDNRIDVPQKTHLHLTEDAAENTYNYENDFKWNRSFPGYYFEYNNFDGVFLGGGPKIVKYGFRKNPAVTHYLRLNYAPKTGASNLRYTGTWYERAGNWNVGSELKILFPKSYKNFFGLGNDTSLQERGNKYYRARLSQYEIQTYFSQSFNNVLNVKAGSLFNITKVEKSDEENIINDVDKGISESTFEDQWFNAYFVEASFKDVDNEVNPKQGYKLSLANTANIGVINTSKTFTTLAGNLQLFYPIRFSPQIVIAHRTGGAHTFGSFPFYSANTIGGTTNLRGFRGNRFSGRSTFYTNSEIRVELFDFYRYLLGGKVGLSAFYDTGRVWTDDENSSLWHEGYGGGVWFNAFDSMLIRSTIGLSKEDTIFELKAGFFF